jgi:RHS repeat-associated protein
MNGAGTSLIDQVTYDGFGNVTSETQPSNGDRWKYTGREYDNTIGLQRNGARYLANGRWTAEDPSGFGGDDPNLYRYAGNNPINGTDPSGLDKWKSSDDTVWDWGNSLPEWDDQIKKVSVKLFDGKVEGRITAVTGLKPKYGRVGIEIPRPCFRIDFTGKAGAKDIDYVQFWTHVFYFTPANKDGKVQYNDEMPLIALYPAAVEDEKKRLKFLVLSGRKNPDTWIWRVDVPSDALTPLANSILKSKYGSVNEEVPTTMLRRTWNTDAPGDAIDVALAYLKDQKLDTAEKIKAKYRRLTSTAYFRTFVVYTANKKYIPFARFAWKSTAYWTPDMGVDPKGYGDKLKWSQVFEPNGNSATLPDNLKDPLNNKLNEEYDGNIGQNDRGGFKLPT